MNVAEYPEGASDQQRAGAEDAPAPIGLRRNCVSLLENFAQT